MTGPGVLSDVVVSGPRGEASGALVLGTAVVALALLLLFYGALNHVLTVTHEGGHALFAILAGGFGLSVLVDRRGGGVTNFLGVAWLGGIVVTLMGYLGSSFFGVLGAVLLAAGQPAAVLWVSLLFLGLLLPISRNLFGALVILATGATMLLAARYAAPGLQSLIAFTWVWFLLFGGVADVMELRSIRRINRRIGAKDRSSDPYQLWRSTFIPPTLWVAFFFVCTTGALVLGASILLGFFPPTDI